MVDDIWKSPAGRDPLSRSSSHSYPSVPVLGLRVSVWLEVRFATAVLRQKRRGAYLPGTLMSEVPPLIVKNWPVSAFCGFPPSVGGLKRGSAQVPVHVGVMGSTGLSKCVSL